MEHNALTTRDIFDQIVALQKQLTENSYLSLHRFSDAIISYCSGDDANDTAREAGDLSEISSVFIQREVTLQKMLDMYKQMYNDALEMEKTLMDRVLPAKNSYES
ncbi:MAG: hypothetical protein IJY12_05470 [Clostridia bacterium]|nr:hypothetical protein [Clostridia bacterium]